MCGRPVFLLLETPFALVMNLKIEIVYNHQYLQIGR